MQGSAIFLLSGEKVTFTADERVDSDLFVTAFNCVNLLDRVIESVPGARQDNDRTWAADLVTLYFSARLHGASAAGLFLVAHGLGREAVHMERAQYEYFVKLVYYNHREDESLAFVSSIPKQALDFAKKAQFKWAATEEGLAEAERLVDHDLDFVSLRTKLLKDSRFTRQANDNQLIRGFLTNAFASFRNHWLWASAVQHASSLDMQNVVVQNEDGSLTINVDERLKHPNLSIVDFAQRCFVAAVWVSTRFKLAVGDDSTQLAERLQAGAKRHAEEEQSVRGMHD
jgi:hypothetical protein